VPAALRPSRSAGRPAGSLLVVTVTLWAVAACAVENPGDFSPSPSPEAAVVRVQNGTVQDVRVSLLRGPTPIYLGRVGSLDTRSFRVTRAVLGPGGEVRIQVEAIPGGRRYRSVAVLVDPGRRVELVLASNLSLSSIAVR